MGTLSMQECALVLEGGGLRGVYTSGVLRALVDLGFEFPYVIGTSMGACNGANFVSRQWERNRVVNIRYVRDRRYLSYARLLGRGELFGMDFIYRTIPLQLAPFDFETFFANPVRYLLTTTDVITGECVYYDKNRLDNESLMTVMRASTSLPWIGMPVMHDGRKLMDGGLSNSIPLARAIEDGFRNSLVILTQPADYRKAPSRGGPLLRLRHPGLHGLHDCLAKRHEVYNRQLELVAVEESRGRVFVIRPTNALTVGRVERDPVRLHRLFEQGYEETMARSSELADWLAATRSKG